MAQRSQEDLEKIDETLFANARAKPLPPVNLSETYASSFINSIDEEVIPGISQAILAKGINPASLPVGTIVLVVFPDGTKATFVKVNASGSVQWEWAGRAWNAEGKPITRNGALKTGGVTGASGDGQVNVQTGAVHYALTAGQSCQISTSIHDPAGGFTYSVWHIIPC